jgi:hypothetical protein
MTATKYLTQTTLREERFILSEMLAHHGGKGLVEQSISVAKKYREEPWTLYSPQGQCPSDLLPLARPIS